MAVFSAESIGADAPLRVLREIHASRISTAARIAARTSPGCNCLRARAARPDDFRSVADFSICCLAGVIQYFAGGYSSFHRPGRRSSGRHRIPRSRRVSERTGSAALRLVFASQVLVRVFKLIRTNSAFGSIQNPKTNSSATTLIAFASSLHLRERVTLPRLSHTHARRRSDPKKNVIPGSTPATEIDFIVAGYTRGDIPITRWLRG